MRTFVFGRFPATWRDWLHPQQTFYYETLLALSHLQQHAQRLKLLWVL
jgi:hypothetical protein